MRDFDALIAFLGDRLNVPFAWRDHDCCSFGFDAARAQTGYDAWADERGRYTTERGALRVVRRYGGMEAIAAARFEPVAVSMAQRGDIGLAPSGRPGLFAFSLVVIEGGTCVLPGEHGLMRLPRAVITAAWNIERPIMREIG